MEYPRSWINEHFSTAVLELACTLQSIPAPTFQETRRAQFLEERFKKLGLHDVSVDAAGNVLARLPGTPGAPANKLARPLVISAHMDTVHPIQTTLSIQRLEDRFIGHGIGDNALGLAALVSMAQLLIEKGVALPGDVWFVANVQEEGLGNLRGMRAVVDHFSEEPIAYLVLEGIGLGTVLHRGLGVERYRVTMETPGGHSWADFGQPSAIHEICRLVNAITAIPLPAAPCTSLNVGILQGGTSVNTIAAQAHFELDLRSEDETTLLDLARQVKQCCEQAQKPGVTVKVQQIGKRSAGKIAAEHPLVRLAQDTLKSLQIEPRLDIASTDANLPLSRGYPAVCVGITTGCHAHSAKETISLQPVVQGLAQVYLLITQVWTAIR